MSAGCGRSLSISWSMRWSYLLRKFLIESWRKHFGPAPTSRPGSLTRQDLPEPVRSGRGREQTILGRNTRSRCLIRRQAGSTTLCETRLLTQPVRCGLTPAAACANRLGDQPAAIGGWAAAGWSLAKIVAAIGASPGAAIRGRAVVERTVLDRLPVTGPCEFLKYGTAALARPGLGG